MSKHPYRIVKSTRDEEGRYHSYNDEPALVQDDGALYWLYWYRHDEVHRTTGPAVISTSGRCLFYIDDSKVGFDEFKQRYLFTHLEEFDEAPYSFFGTSEVYLKKTTPQ